MKTGHFYPIQQNSRLRGLRQAMGKGWTQQFVAKQIGCDLKTYRDWESTGKQPGSFFAIELSKLFGVSTDYILGVSTFTNIGNAEMSEATGLSVVVIDFLRLLKNDSQHYANNIGAQTINFINRVLEACAEHLKRDTDGDIIPEQNIFSLMEQYICSEGITGTIYENDSCSAENTHATSGTIWLNYSNTPIYDTVSRLAREAIVSDIRKTLDFFKEKEAASDNGKHQPASDD